MSIRNGVVCVRQSECVPTAACFLCAGCAVCATGSFTATHRSMYHAPFRSRAFSRQARRSGDPIDTAHNSDQAVYIARPWTQALRRPESLFTVAVRCAHTQINPSGCGRTACVRRAKKYPSCEGYFDQDSAGAEWCDQLMQRLTSLRHGPAGPGSRRWRGKLQATSRWTAGSWQWGPSAGALQGLVADPSPVRD